MNMHFYRIKQLEKRLKDLEQKMDEEKKARNEGEEQQQQSASKIALLYFI